jgi:hypothetical protein
MFSALGPYVALIRIVPALVALGGSFALGYRTADDRATVQKLRIALATKQADLDNAAKSAALEKARATEIEARANAQQQSDADYIATLQARPACLLDDDDVRVLGRVRQRSGAARLGRFSRSAASP